MKQRASICGVLLFALPVFSGILYAYEQVLDLGMIPPDVPVKRTILFENKDSVPLKIKRVASSCECLRIISPPSGVLPRSKDKIEFSLTPRKPGEVKYEITVEFADAAKAALRYLVTATVHEAESASGAKTRKREYIISSESARSLWKENGKTAFVDVRSKEQFDNMRIAGSVNLPLFAVKTKNFLKNAKVVLMDEGYGYATLEKECGNLRQAGWDAWILGGGLNGWLRRGYPVEGDRSRSPALNLMPPAALTAEKDFDNWVIIDASGPKEKRTNSGVMNVVRLPFSKESSEFSISLGKAFEKKKNDPSFSAVIVTARGEGYEAIEKRISSGRAGLSAGAIFYLAGGWEGYRRFQEQKNNLLQPGTGKTTGKITRGTKGSGIHGKPCSTCP